MLTDAEFIKANYDSFLDNVVNNQTMEFWAGTLTDAHDGRYLMDGLHTAMSAWRCRLTLEQNDTQAQLEEEKQQWWAQQNQDEEFIKDNGQFGVGS